MNQLYYGDNLQVLREHIADESVDLIYFDLPKIAGYCVNQMKKARRTEEY